MTTMTIPDVSISPTILTRIGGLPVDAVPGASAEIGACLERLDHIEETLDELAQPLIDRIFDVVPTIEDPKARRLVLQAKRQVFAGKAVQARAAEALRANAPAGVASAFDAWEAVRAEREDLESRLEALLGADDDAMRDALTHTVSDTAYLSSLALATPELVDRLIHHKPGRKPSERLVRSLYNYATRTALKTSPFSGLTTVNVAGAVGRGRSTQTVAMHLASGLLHQAARDGEAHPGLVLTPSPVGKVPAEEHDELVMLAQHVHHDGVIFREELVAGAEWAIGEYSDSFTPEVSNARIRRHLEAGLLREQVPWKRGEEPLGALSTVFPEGIGGVSVEDMLGARSVGQECSRSDATGRTDALRRLKDFSSQVFDRGELGSRPSGLLYEDREAPFVVPDVLTTPGLREDLHDLAEITSPWVFRSFAYDLMVRRFVERYGVGGRCDSPLSFCMALAVDNDGDPELSAAFKQNMRASADEAQHRSLLPCGGTAAPRHIGVMLQPVAPTWEDLSGPNHLVVLNNSGNGIGAYQARFHRLFGERFRAELESEITGLWPRGRVLELTTWAECNTGQAVCSGVLPELQLPSEPTSPRGVALESLSLVHDPATDSLELWDDDGPVGLAYLGLTPQHLLNGYLRWVALLADPWVRFPPMTESYRTLTSGYQRLGNGEIRHEPREIMGRRLVTQRESWRMTPATLLDDTVEGDGLSVRRVHEWRLRYGIPQKVFIQQLNTGGGTTNDRRKPQYVDFASRTSLASLWHWLDRRTRGIRITEALPAVGEHPFHDPAGLPRVSELAVSLRWPRQEAWR